MQFNKLKGRIAERILFPLYYDECWILFSLDNDSSNYVIWYYDPLCNRNDESKRLMEAYALDFLRQHIPDRHVDLGNIKRSPLIAFPYNKHDSGLIILNFMYRLCTLDKINTQPIDIGAWRKHLISRILRQLAIQNF